MKVGDDYTTIQMPSFGDNLAFFFDYQVGYMYMRYFLWNFVGRQNDFHGQVPGDRICGNWESGITFLDRIRLGDQSEAPSILKENKGKNHYFFLPLILGLLGLFFQIKHDSRNSWVTGLLFLLTGLAIVIYLNQPPYQVRERDYAYAGSFYVFALWIGLGVMWVQDKLEKVLKGEDGIPAAAAAAAICLCVPVIMGCQNWDDHDRSGRYTARDMAFNHLMSTDKDAIIVTHGDNDTFPLWYAQEVESIRTDVRIVNTSLLGTDWYIDQLKNSQYEAKPLEIDIPRIQYLYGTNDFPYVIDAVEGRPVLAREAIEIFKNPKYRLSDGKTDFIPAKKLLIPVDKENVRKYHIVPESEMDKVEDFVELEIGGDRIGKTDLIILDYLSNYKWDRPFYFVTPNADVDLGLGKWSMYNGFCYKLVPVRTEDSSRQYMDADQMYDRLMNVFRFETLACDDVNYDYQNIYTFCAVVPVRDMFFNTANEMFYRGDREKCIALLDKCVEVMPASNFPYNISWMRSINEISILRIIELYLMAGEKDKAVAMADEFVKETVAAVLYFNSDFGGEPLSKKFMEDNVSLFSYLTDIMEKNGLPEKSAEYQALLF